MVKLNKYIISFIITIIFILPSSIHAKKDLSKKIKINGVAEIGVFYNEMDKHLSNVTHNVKYNEFERIGKIELGLKFIPFKKNYLAFDVEYEFGQPSIKVDKLFIGFKLKKGHLLKTGYMKKPFGVEELTGGAERLFIDRSAFYDYIKSFNFFGEDLMIQYRVKKKVGNKKNNLTASGSFAADFSKHFYGVFNGSILLKPGKISTSIMYVYFQRPFFESHTVLSSLAFEQKHKIICTDFELIFGIDPNATRLEHILYEDRNVFFIGGRVLQAYKFPTKINIISEVVPLWETDLFVMDSKLKKKIWQIRPGINLFLGRKKITRLMISLDFRYSTDAPDHDVFTKHLIGYLGQLKFVW